MDKAHELASMFAAHGPIAANSNAELAHRSFDVAINSTSAGLGGADADASPWPDIGLAAGSFAYDLIYASEPTPFLRWARGRGAGGTADGLGMLIEQAAESFFLWRGVRPDTASAFTLLRPGAR
jgi:shikimate dehydrogenase